MKRTWSIVSSVSFVMLLTFIVIFSWMWFSDRIDMAKLTTVRDVLMGTPSMMDAAQDAPDLESRPSQEGSSTRLLESRGSEARSIAASRLGLRQESDIRQRQIEQALDQLAQARENLAIERAAFRAAIESASQEDEGRDPASQFRRSVQLMESAQPNQAKVWLLAMVEDDRFDDAVATLDAMRERSASRILREFKSAGELELAGQLLEALGRYGTIPEDRSPMEVSSRDSYGVNKPNQP